MKKITIHALDRYDLGIKYGELLGADIKKMVQVFDQYLKNNFKLLHLAEPLILSVLDLAKDKFGKELLLEMQGISKSSGVDLRWIHLMNMTYELGTLLNSSLHFLGCSSFVLPQKDGKSVFVGKTTDIVPDGYLTNALIELRIFIQYQIGDTGNTISTVIFPGQVASDFTIVNNSLYIGFNDGGMDTQNNDLANESIIPFIVRLSENSKDIAAAQILIQQFHTIHPFICIVSDGTEQNTFSADLMPHKVRFHINEKGIVRANHLQDEDDRAELYSKNYKDSKYFKSSIARSLSLENEIKNIYSIKQEFDLNDIKSLLSLHESTFDYFKGSVSNTATSNALIWDGSLEKLYLPASTEDFPVTLEKTNWINLLDQI